MTARSNYQQAIINISSGTQNTVFTTGTNGGAVWELYMTCAAATTVTFYDGAGMLTGNINVAAGAAINRPDWGQSPMFFISPNSNFSISDATGTQKSGYVHYSRQ